MLILGAWLAGSVFMTWVATGNFRSVERVLTSESAKAQKELGEAGLARARSLLRYHSSEQNRHYFYYWELVQIVLAILLCLVLLFATNGNKLVMGLSIAMTLLILVMHFAITPQVTETGRALDFSTSDEMTAEREVFWNYHHAYSAMELSKIGLGLLLGIRMIYRSPESRRRSGSRKKVDAVDHADHTHVDG